MGIPRTTKNCRLKYDRWADLAAIHCGDFQAEVYFHENGQRTISVHQGRVNILALLFGSHNSYGFYTETEARYCKEVIHRQLSGISEWDNACEFWDTLRAILYCALECKPPEAPASDETPCPVADVMVSDA